MRKRTRFRGAEARTMVPGPLCGPGRGMMAHARVEGCRRREETDGFKA